MAKLKSTAVKVYPTAFRGPSSGPTKYNPESRLNTEFNVTNLTNRVVSKDNFVIDWNFGSKIIKFNIHGYYFESDLTEFLGVGGEGVAWTNLYASIKLLPFQTSESGNTAYKAFTLVGTEDSGSTVSSSGRILDVDSSGTFIFEGVDLHQTAINPVAGTDVYELHLLSGGPSAWAVPLNSRLKFLATDVEGLPTINNSTTLKTNNTIFAPTTAGTAGQLSVSQGGTSAPTWISTADVVVGEASQAVQLKTVRTLWGQDFDGTENVDGTIENTNGITPKLNNTSSIGSPSKVYANVYATTFTGNVSGNVTGNLTGNADTATTASTVTANNYTSVFGNVYSPLFIENGPGNRTPMIDSRFEYDLFDGTLYAPKFSGSFSGSATLSGTPTAPTAANTVNNTQIATTAFVRNKLTDFIKYDFQGTDSSPLNSTTYAFTGLSVQLKIFTQYKFKILVLYTRASGSSSAIFLSPHGNYGGGPSPSGYFIPTHNATPTATSITTAGIKIVNSTDPSDAGALTLPNVNGAVGASWACLEGVFYTANSTGLALDYKFGSSGAGNLTILQGSYIVVEEMFV
jgi:hypothetical protein